MIQLNLLPDIKLEYIRAKRSKLAVILISSTAGGVSLGIFILLFLTVNVFQKTHIDNLSADIVEQRAELDKTEDLDKILTVQNQLNSLTGLHEQKPVATRLFGYLPQLVPQEVSIAEITTNYTDKSMKIVGSTDAISTVNKFVDTLKFTEYTNDEDVKTRAFSGVVLESFSKSPEETSFSIVLTFDPYIFDLSKKPQLTVPSIISTRSETEKPTEDLFRELINPTDQETQ